MLDKQKHSYYPWKVLVVNKEPEGKKMFQSDRLDLLTEDTRLCISRAIMV